jgi:hypothetical protein
MQIWFTKISGVGTVMALSLGWILLNASLSLGEEPNNTPPSPPDTPYPSRPLDMALEKAREVPSNTWRRIEDAQQWVWDEYPDQVLVQEEPRIKWRRYLSAALATPDWLDLAGAVRLRREGFDYPFAADQEGTTWQWAQRSRFRVSTRWKAFRAQVELQGSSSGEDAQTDVVGTSTFNAGNVQQMFVSVTLPNFWETGLRTDLHVGRINLDIGSRRLVSRSNFGNTSQAFDGIHWNLANQALWQFRAFFSQAVFETDTTDRLALFANSDTLFWGLSYETHQVPWSRIHLYYLGADGERTDNLESRTHSTFGLRLYQPPKAGRLDYDGESVWQVGRINEIDHFAFFQHVSLGYTFDVPWSPRLLAMYDYASGTDSPNGNYSQTFDGLFGARRGEFTPTSLFGPFYRSNISSPGVRLILKPRPLLAINVKFRAWYLAQSRDAWVNSGLQDSTGRSGNVLGQDVEVRVQWHPYPNLSFDAGYDHFFKGSYIKNQTNVPGNPSAHDTNYFYVQTEVKF